MNERYNRSIQRINKIDLIKCDNTYKRSNNILAKEYLRRIALFMEYISVDHKYPFFRAADVLERDNIISFYEVCPQLVEVNCRDPKSICKYYIEWSALADEGEPLALKFEGMYEPVIKLFERGVHLRIQHQFLEVGGGNSLDLTKGIRAYASETPLDISEIALDNYDKSL